MLYAAYQAHSDIMGAVRAFAGVAARSIGNTGVGTPGHGVVRNLTRSSGVAERSPSWSPDGKLIAYFSDRTGEYQLTVRAADGSGDE